MAAAVGCGMTRSLLPFALLLGSALAMSGCYAASPDDGLDDFHEEETGSGEDAIIKTVGDAVSASCTTSSVKGLSLQIIAEGNCISPGAYSKVPDLGNVSFNAGVFPFLEKPARDKLEAALKANPNKHMTVVSMLRTVAQQFLLYKWYQAGRCGIPLAAKPGNSNHETGLAMDISEYNTWKTALESRGFDWLGSSDPAHYDYEGSGAVNHKGLDVKAFQRLWNRNHPDDKIAVDGEWGPQTEARMKKAPAGGFEKGASCN